MYGKRSFRNTKKQWYTSGDRRYYLKSSWEILYAEYLDSLLEKGKIVQWEYEPHTFWFENIKRGVRSYVPDFLVEYPDGRVEYHEVKGYLDPKSKTKLKRMAKYHPDISLKLIDKKVLDSLGLTSKKEN